MPEDRVSEKLRVLPEVTQQGSNGVRIQTQVWQLPASHTTALGGSDGRPGQEQKEEGAGCLLHFPAHQGPPSWWQLNNLGSSDPAHHYRVPGLSHPRLQPQCLTNKPCCSLLIIFALAADLSAFMTSSPLDGDREQKTGPYVTVVFTRKSQTLYGP